MQSFMCFGRELLEIEEDRIDLLQLFIIETS